MLTLSNSSKRLFYIALILLSLLGMFLLWRSTPYGLGLVNDSAYYIEGADNLLAGKGYVRTSGGGEVKPITHFPPFFSLLLAARLYLINARRTWSADNVVVDPELGQHDQLDRYLNRPCRRQVLHRLPQSPGNTL